jgi:Ca2+-binding RTX toxin-like protein
MSHGLTIDLSKFGTNLAVNSVDFKLTIEYDASIEDVYATNYDDTIIGNSRDNNLHGFDGNDVIAGGGGADNLYGGNGEDKLRSDALDHVFGGTGKDWFDEYYEATPNLTNPRPGRYMDWKVV